MSEAEFESRGSVDDPEGYRHRQRLKSVLSAREAVPEKRWDANEFYHFGEIDAHTRNTVIRNAVENYIIEVEQLMKNTETSRPYWPGLEFDDEGEVEDAVFLGSMALPNGEVEEFYGLQSIVDCPSPIVVQWTEKTESHVEGTTTTQRESVLQIERDILIQAYRVVNAFLYEIGMDLDLDNGRPVYAVEPEVGHGDI